MRSDGIILDEPLRKDECPHCGGAVGSFTDVAAAYRRSNGMSPFDVARHHSIAEGIVDIARRYSIFGPILEVGAASFQTAIEVARQFPDSRTVAIDPSPEVVPETDLLDCRTCRLEDADFQCSFGFIYSNHVLEHVPDPSDFLSALSSILHDQGLIVVVCPNGQVPSHELLFADHLSHFTDRAMFIVAASAGLSLVEAFDAPWDRLSRIFLLRRQPAAEPSVPYGLSEARKAFFEKWSEAQNLLLSEINSPLIMFGAGEYSQIIRAYLPRLYDLVECLIVDKVTGTRDFDRPIRLVSDVELKGREIVLAVHPGSVDVLRRRMLDHGAARVHVVGARQTA